MKKLKLNMRDKKSKISPQYIREKLANGEFQTLLNEARREGPIGLRTMEEIHGDEKEREARTRALLNAKDKALVIAMDTTTWTFGAYSINLPERALDEVSISEDESHNGNGDEVDVAPPFPNVADFQIATASCAVDISNKIIDELANSKLTTYEDIISRIGRDDITPMVLDILGQSKKPILEIETPEGRLHIGGHFDMADSVPSEIMRTAVCDVRDVNDDAQGSGSITLRIVAINDEVSEAPFKFEVDQQVTAHLFTVNDQRSNRLLHFSKYIGEYIVLELQFKYVFSTGRWASQCTSIVNEAELVELERTPRRIFETL